MYQSTDKRRERSIGKYKKFNYVKCQSYIDKALKSVERVKHKVVTQTEKVVFPHISHKFNPDLRESFLSRKKSQHLVSSESPSKQSLLDKKVISLRRRDLRSLHKSTIRELVRDFDSNMNSVVLDTIPRYFKSKSKSNLRGQD